MTLPRLKLPWLWYHFGGLLAMRCGRHLVVAKYEMQDRVKFARRHGALAE